MNPKEKARKLMALALSPGTPVEEARTAAMAALRVIEEYKLLDQPYEAPRAPAPPPPQRVSRERRHVRVHIVDTDAGGVSSEEFRRTIEDIFGFGVRAPEHEVASTKHYPTHRVIRAGFPCAGCGRPIPEGSLVTVSLDEAGREVFWHRPCWDRGRHG